MKESERRAPLFVTDPEVEAMVRAADKLRDKAFIATYGEMGACLYSSSRNAAQ